MDLSTKVIPTRTVAIYPNTRGFGYSVMESALNVTEMKLISPKKFDFNKILKLMREVISIHGPATLLQQ